MKYAKLGTTDIDISRICLGTMTWGIQNDQADADGQMDMALDMGVNFWDTAEMYPMGAQPSQYGDTETILGDWMRRHASRRGEVVLATKHSPVTDHPTGRSRQISKQSITLALEESLKKLNTDYVDLYQLHWPTNRRHYHFSQYWNHQHASGTDERDRIIDNQLESVHALTELQKAGKIRSWGLSDDTAWGLNSFLRIADENGLARPQSIQHEYHLLLWMDEVIMQETCALEGVSYLPWGPIVGGLLSGKYNDGKRPAGARYSKHFERPEAKRNQRVRQGTLDAVASYLEFAGRFDIDITQLAIAWTIRQPWMSSTIIGATNLENLKTNIDAVNFEITDEMYAALAALRLKHPLAF